MSFARKMQLGAVSSVASCAGVPYPSTARCDWVPCPLLHLAHVCPVPQPRDAPGSHVLSPQDATRSVSSVASCTWVPCLLSHLAPGCPVLCRILHMGALSHLGSGCPVPSCKMQILIQHRMAYQI